MSFFDDFSVSGDGSDGSSTTDLISSLADNATSAFETYSTLNANPLNAALVTGGTVSTPQGTASGASPFGASGSMIGWLLAAVAVVVVVIFVSK